MRTTRLEGIMGCFEETSRERNDGIGYRVNWAMKDTQNRVYNNLRQGAARTFNFSEFEPTGTLEEKFLTLYRGLYWIHLTSGARNGTEACVQLTKLWRLYDRNLQAALAWSENLLSIFGAKRFYTIMIEEVNRGQKNKITMV